MKNFLKNSILLGVGVYSKAEKELERSIKGLIKKNKISRKEGEEMLTSFIESSKAAEKKMESQIKKNVNSFAKRVSMAKQKDLVSLSKRVKQLEAKLGLKKAPQKRKTAKRSSKK